MTTAVLEFDGDRDKAIKAAHRTLRDLLVTHAAMNPKMTCHEFALRVSGLEPDDEFIQKTVERMEKDG